MAWTALAYVTLSFVYNIFYNYPTCKRAPRRHCHREACCVHRVKENGAPGLARRRAAPRPHAWSAWSVRAVRAVRAVRVVCVVCMVRLVHLSLGKADAFTLESHICVKTLKCVTQ